MKKLQALTDIKRSNVIPYVLLHQLSVWRLKLKLSINICLNNFGNRDNNTIYQKNQVLDFLSQETDLKICI